MRIPRINCLFHTDNDKCAHLERGRGFLWLGKFCILHDKFPSECYMRTSHPKPKPPPSPPKKRIVSDCLSSLF